jgi:hypothetical protein
VAEAEAEAELPGTHLMHDADYANAAASFDAAFEASYAAEQDRQDARAAAIVQDMMHPARRPAEGYESSQPEFAWLRARSEPPPHSLVWLGCRGCQQATPVRYAPSSASLPASDDSQVEGHLATFTLGYVAFQVFTVDYVAVGRHQASA